MPLYNKYREILSNIDIEEIKKIIKKFNEMIKEYPKFEDLKIITGVENDGKYLLGIDD